MPFSLAVPQIIPVVPVPEAAKPVLVLLLVQEYVAVVLVLVKFNAACVAPLHTFWSAGSTTLGAALTVTVILVALPAQPAAVGVT